MYLTARIIRLKNIIKIENNKTIDMRIQINSQNELFY